MALAVQYVTSANNFSFAELSKIFLDAFGKLLKNIFSKFVNDRRNLFCLICRNPKKTLNNKVDEIGVFFTFVGVLFVF